MESFLIQFFGCLVLFFLFWLIGSCWKNRKKEKSEAGQAADSANRKKEAEDQA